MKSVSIIIPAYNASRWIAEALRSVLEQDYGALEVIVVDDGSTDRTAAVIAGFAGRVKCLRQENLGLARARNAGIRVAQGEYIAFLDADDIWLPQKIRLQIDALDDSGMAWVYSDAYAFDDRTGRALHNLSQLTPLNGGDVLQPLLLSNFIPSPTPMVSRTVFQEVGLFYASNDPTSKNPGEDWDMWLRIAARHPVALINSPLAGYRVLAESLSHSRPIMMEFRGSVRVIERAVRREPNRLAPLRNRALANVCLRLSRIAAQRGDLPKARQLLARAIRLAPMAAAPYFYLCGCMAGGTVVELATRLRRWLRHRRAIKRAPL
jgi:glycosyltransferase involved in cell wall biosynthesis